MAAMRIALYGASGRIGSRICAEAVSRGHQVTGLDRAAHPHVPEGVTGRYGDATDADDVARVASEHDVVVSAIAPSRVGGRPRPFLDALTTLADNVGTRRLVVIGDAGTLHVTPGLRWMDTTAFPSGERPEAEAHAAALALLRDTGALVEWLYVSPAKDIQAGDRTGVYRIGLESPIGDVVSIDDFAAAVIDEIETPRYRRTRINIAH
jgi:putative NADH-flavin reductase